MTNCWKTNRTYTRIMLLISILFQKTFCEAHCRASVAHQRTTVTILTSYIYRYTHKLELAVPFTRGATEPKLQHKLVFWYCRKNVNWKHIFITGNTRWRSDIPITEKLIFAVFDYHLVVFDIKFELISFLRINTCGFCIGLVICYRDISLQKNLFNKLMTLYTPSTEDR